MSRKIRTEDELKGASEHLHYEIWMLISLANGIGSGIAGQGPIANALLESFIVHVRNLMDFFYNDNPKPDDVIAEDYFEKADAWRQLRPVLSGLLKQAKRRAGKELAHLTYARLDVALREKPWPFVEISNEIVAVTNIFFESVPRSKLSVKWNRTNWRLKSPNPAPVDTVSTFCLCSGISTCLSFLRRLFGGRLPQI